MRFYPSFLAPDCLVVYTVLNLQMHNCRVQEDSLPVISASSDSVSTAVCLLTFSGRRVLCTNEGRGALKVVNFLIALTNQDEDPDSDLELDSASTEPNQLSSLQVVIIYCTSLTLHT